MSHDVRDLLESTTPPDPPEVDYDAIVRRGRRRRVGKRLGVVAAVGVFAAAVAVGIELPAADPGAPDVADRPGDGRQDGAPPTPERLTADADLDPVGSWSQLGRLPAGPRVEPVTGTLDDGRVIVFGGMDSGIDGRPGRHDGVLVDPTSGTATPLPDAPLQPGPVVHGAVAGDRLLVLGRQDGAVYDVASQRWTTMPELPVQAGEAAVVAFDGDTVVIGGAASGAAGGGYPSLHAWTVGDPDWRSLGEGPLQPGGEAVRGGATALAGSAFDGRRLALWAAPAGGDGPRAAVYDLEEDTWTALRDELLPDTEAAALAFVDAGLAVVPIQPQPTTIVYPRTDPPPPVADPVVVDLAAMDSGPLPPIPDQVRDAHFAPVTNGPTRAVTRDGRPAPLTLHEDVGHTAQMPKLVVLRPDGTWSPVIQARQVAAHDGTVVATSVGHAFPNLAPLEAAVLTDDGWAPTPDSDLDNRSGAGLALAGDRLLVVGGWSARPPVDGEEPDVSPSHPEEPGPYVLDLHDSIWQLDLTTR